MCICDKPVSSGYLQLDHHIPPPTTIDSSRELWDRFAGELWDRFARELWNRFAEQETPTLKFDKFCTDKVVLLWVLVFQSNLVSCPKEKQERIDASIKRTAGNHLFLIKNIWKRWSFCITWNIQTPAYLLVKMHEHHRTLMKPITVHGEAVICDRTYCFPEDNIVQTLWVWFPVYQGLGPVPV